MTDLPSPLGLLEAGVSAWAPHLQSDGTLHDPVLDAPTQYGTAYLAWCCAVLGTRPDAADGPVQRDRAVRAMAAALAHTADPSRPPHASGFDRRTLSVTGRLNHRDFTWPPLLKTRRALAAAGVALDPDVDVQVAGVDVETAFRARPPSNWAAVWMSGELLRVQAGLAPTTPAQLDDWVDVFFAGGEVGLDLELGLYVERGLPNAYDLFTRLHLTDLLVQGYDGRNRERLVAFLSTGLRRSLDLQLSDGSMASGYRSAGQTWVLGAQVALFTASRVLGLGSDADREEARLAAWRAYRALALGVRPEGVFSPVQNVLPPELRVGYEAYTADGHYSPLALAFLADALVHGFGEDEPPGAAELDARPAVVRVEGAPTHRGAVSRGRVSLAVQAAADPTYDASGLVDLTFGTGRSLVFVSAARHLEGGPWLVPGLALRDEPGASPVTPPGPLPRRLAAPLRAEGDVGLAFTAAFDDGDLAGREHRWSASLTGSGVDVVETVPGWSGRRTLLVPYLHDRGDGVPTAVTRLADGVRFARGAEWVEVRVDGPLERRSVLPAGYANRRGLCGLVRLDLAEPGETLRWSVTSGPA
ncbi:hypothetical protein ACFFOM_14060 [Microlunatus capsulatus]|uniref:Uncharacterized protein n=1 Tax=Microlunatus capsulatus TaxID=99117 RepID=A0ABS4Z7W5_9ACTN|nr:hypothetical protein [Microlunatus capsulatus]MBP2417128.1 hypothetical protein [Microlunatus capsulatus]